MEDRITLPIGRTDFRTIRETGSYYIDKTHVISRIIRDGSVSIQFTRPRRFGKTTFQSMLRSFFDIREDSRDIFSGLAVMEDREAVENWMNRYPVVYLSFKDIDGLKLEYAIDVLRSMLVELFQGYGFLRNDDLGGDAGIFGRILLNKASIGDIRQSLNILAKLLYNHYGRKVIFIFDEYDVPLENAYFGGFYERMSAFIRSLFESALKTNPALEFAAVTGCLRISRESIFTGLNNLNVCSIISDSYGEHFGFLQAEVDEMLDAYGFSDKREIMSRWYDGYVFGGQEVYNPWSAVNYVSSLTFNPQALPKPYWSNTSSNSIVRELVGRADMGAKRELEELLAGGTIEKPVHEEITYDSMYASQDNLWNFLFFTGYLKKTGERMEENAARISLAIPNAEVKYIYENTIKNWFMEDVGKRDLSGLYQALFAGNAEETEKNLSTRPSPDLLRSSRFRDGTGRCSCLPTPTAAMMTRNTPTTRWDR